MNMFVLLNTDCLLVSFKGAPLMKNKTKPRNIKLKSLHRLSDALRIEKSVKDDKERYTRVKLTIIFFKFNFRFDGPRLVSCF
jgi:hypothetical protein